MLNKSNVNNLSMNNRLNNITQIMCKTSDSSVFMNGPSLYNDGCNNHDLVYHNTTPTTEYISDIENSMIDISTIPNLNESEPSIKNISRSDFEKLFNLEHLNESNKSRVYNLLWQYKECFALSDCDLTGTSKFSMEIPTSNESPVYKKHYSIREKDKPFVEQSINTLLKCGGISRTKSTWGHPVLVVKKKCGSSRLVVDYRDLNERTIKYKHILPKFEDMLSKLKGATCFCSIDLRAGFWQMPIAEKDRFKTCFLTHMGSFKFNWTPFGLCGASEYFQLGIFQVLSEYYMKIVVGIIDDLNIFGKGFEKTFNNFELILIKLREANLKIKPSKCQLFKESVEFFGHILTPKGITVIPSKIEDINKFNCPTNVKEMQSFFGHP